MTIENQQKTGASGSEGGQTPPAPTAPKMEFKEGSVFVDGKKMVAESDLIAAKKSLETQLEKAQATHNEAYDSAKLELSAAQKQVAELSAKLKEAQSAPGQGANSEEIARIKQEKADALAKVEALTAEAAKSLELKRQLLKVQYPGVTDEQLAKKSMKELDSFEEALKAVSSSRGGGVGAYAIGGGLGQTAPMSDLDRAKKLLEITPVRGVRNAPAQ